MVSFIPSLRDLLESAFSFMQTAAKLKSILKKNPMALELKKRQGILIFSFFAILQHSSQQDPRVPCFFIMGESIFDNGNNNNLSTLAKSNYPPYGIDFPKGPTGRFTNGRNLADVIAQQLGFPYFIPPFAQASGNATLKGINYASGAAGILNETGRQQGARITLAMQIENHRVTVSRITQMLGNLPSATYLGKCLYAANFGTNDYLNNYYLPQFYNTSRLYTPQEFADLLIQQYTTQIRNLHEQGARKVAIFGLGQLGCTPFALSLFPTSGSACVDAINSAVQIFNNKLVAAVTELNRNFTHAKFIYINSSGIQSDISLLPGFKVKNASCCPANSTTGLSIQHSVPCPNRSKFVFWDEFHPTEALIIIQGRRAYRAELPTDAFPYDISRLVKQG